MATQGEQSYFLSDINHTLSYQIKLSPRRRTVSLEVKQQEVTVRAPLGTPQQIIDNFLEARQQWLVDKINQQSAVPPQLMKYQDGDEFFYQGQLFQLKLVRGNRFNLSLNKDNQTLEMVLPNRVKNQTQYVKKQFLHFLNTEMRRYLETRMPVLVEQTGLTPSKVEVKFFKTRWGCCYPSGLIKINPLLIGAPSWAIDCVIIHELCHLQHLNHSKAFWQLNQHHCNHCQPTKQWLKQHHYSLSL